MRTVTIYSCLLKTVFFIFGCVGSSLLFRLFSSCGAQGLLATCRVWAPHGCGFSRCSSRSLEHRLSSVAHKLGCSTACGIFLDQGSNSCLLHWQGDSLPLSPQGSPYIYLFIFGSTGSSLLRTDFLLLQRMGAPL